MKRTRGPKQKIKSSRKSRFKPKARKSVKKSPLEKMVKKSKRQGGRNLPVRNNKPNRDIKIGLGIDMSKAIESPPPKGRGIVVYTDGSSSDVDAGGSGWHGYVYDHCTVAPASRDLPRSHCVTPDGYRLLPKKNNEVKPVEYFDGALGYIGKATNNKAELGAVISFLETFADPGVNFGSAKTIKIISDSRYVVDGHGQWMEGWSKRGWKCGTGLFIRDVKNKEEWKSLYSITNNLREDGITIELEWVKGHSNSIGNSRADYLALVGRRNSEFVAFSSDRPESIEVVYKSYPPKDYWSKALNVNALIPKSIVNIEDGVICGIQRSSLDTIYGTEMSMCLDYYPNKRSDEVRTYEAFSCISQFTDLKGMAVLLDSISLGFPSRDIELFGRNAIGKNKKYNDIIVHGNDDIIPVVERIKQEGDHYKALLYESYNGDRQEAYEVYSILSDKGYIEGCAIIDLTDILYKVSAKKNHQLILDGNIEHIVEFDSAFGQQSRVVTIVPGVNLPSLDVLKLIENKRPSVYVVYFSDRALVFAVETSDGVLMSSCDSIPIK